MTISEKDKLKSQIIDAIRKVSDNIGDWADLAKVGIQLSIMGVNYKDYHYGKLGYFLNEFSDVLDFHYETPESGGPPIRYVRIKEDGKHIQSTVMPKKSSGQKKDVVKPTKDMELDEWAYVPYPKTKKLVDMAQKEDWEFRGKELGGLWFYLTNTFKRLITEDKILISNNEDFATFNTGLVDDCYEYIYALFERNTYPNSSIPWCLKGYVIPGVGMGKILTSNFSDLPEKADYFNYEFSNVFFDTSKKMDTDLKHIILRRTCRLPLELLNMVCSPDFLDIDGETLNDAYAVHSEKSDYFKKLGEKIETDQNVMQNLNDRFKNAIEFAKKRVECNYSIATPMYDIKKHRCAMLLPLALIDRSHVDLALVVTLEPSGMYQGHTVLPLDEAYFDSRLIAKPDTAWLKPRVITNDNDTNDTSFSESSNVQVKPESNTEDVSDTTVSEPINNISPKPTDEDIATVDKLIDYVPNITKNDRFNYILEYYTQNNQVNSFDEYFSTRNQ